MFSRYDTRYQRNTLANKDKNKQLLLSNKDGVQKIKKQQLEKVDFKEEAEVKYKNQKEKKKDNTAVRNINIVFKSQKILKVNVMSKQDELKISQPQNKVVPKKQHMLVNTYDEKQTAYQQNFFQDQDEDESFESEESLDMSQFLIKVKQQFNINQQLLLGQKCTQINQFNEVQQLMITRRKINKTISKISEQDLKRIGSIFSDIKGFQKQQKFDIYLFLRYLSDMRNRYQFKLCKCTQKHIILYYKKGLVPTIKQKNQLILQCLNQNKKFSCRQITKIITQLGFKWNCMPIQINKFIQKLKVSSANYGELNRQIFISYNQSYFKYPQLVKVKTNKFNFILCFNSDQYSQFERKVILYWTSSEQNLINKILKTPQLLKILQQSNYYKTHNKQLIIQMIRKFKKFSIQYCQCETKHIRLIYKGFIVPNIAQKQIIIKYFCQKSKSKNKNVIYNNIISSGFNWKYMFQNINSVILQLQKQRNKQISTTSIQQLLETEPKQQNKQFPEQQPQIQKQYQYVDNIVSHVKQPQQQISQQRNKILNRIRKLKKELLQAKKELKREQFIMKHQQ